MRKLARDYVSACVAPILQNRDTVPASLPVDAWRVMPKRFIILHAHGSPIKIVKPGQREQE